MLDQRKFFSEEGFVSSLPTYLFYFSFLCALLFFFLIIPNILSEVGLYAMLGLILLSSFVSLIMAVIDFFRMDEKSPYLGFLFLDISWGLLTTVYSLSVFEDLFSFSSLFPFLVLEFFGMVSSLASLVFAARNIAKGKMVRLNTVTLFFSVPILILCFGAFSMLFFLSGAIG